MIMRIHRRPGFTLIELLLALSLVMVLAAIAVPPLWKGMQTRRHTDQAVSRVMEALREARRQAIRHGVPCLYTIKPGTNQQSIQLLDGKQPPISFDLAPMISIDVEPAHHSSSLLFQSDGSTQGIQLRIFGAIAEQRIRVDHSTGLPQQFAWEQRDGR